MYWDNTYLILFKNTFTCILVLNNIILDLKYIC